MHINEYIKQNRIPSKRVFAEILGITTSTLNNRIHEYGYTEIEHVGDRLAMINPIKDRYIWHNVTKKEIEEELDFYWDQKR